MARTGFELEWLLDFSDNWEDILKNKPFGHLVN